MLPARAATPPSARGESSGPEPPRGRQPGNHPGQSRHLAGDVGPVSRGDGEIIRPEPLRRHPPGGNHPGQSRRGDGSGEIIRARGRHLAGDVGPVSRGTGEIIRPEPLRRHPPGGNHPGQTPPSGRGCMRYRRRSYPARAGDVGPVSRGDGGKDNHHAAGQSRYAAICQGGNQRGGRGRRGNHPPPGTGDNHPGQSRRYAAARAATPPSGRDVCGIGGVLSEPLAGQRSIVDRLSSPGFEPVIELTGDVAPM